MSRSICVAALAVLAFAALGSTGATAGELSPVLASELALHAAGDMVPVVIQMRDAPDYASLDAQATLAHMHRKDRQSFVVGELRAQAERLEEGIRGQLSTLEASGEVSDLRDLWMAGGFAVKATPAAIQLLAARADVYMIGTDAEVNMLDTIMPAQGGGTVTPTPTPTSIRPQPGTRADAWGVDYINAPAVWTMGYNGTGVLVAEIDTGIWYVHTDLANRIWVNDDPWDGVDNDGNGYVDDFNGYDFYTDSGGYDRDPTDDYGHGTHVAGTVCGDGTAGTQTGVAPGAHIMACKILNSSGYGSPSRLVEAVQYAIANGADVVTGSIGWFQPDAATRTMYRNVCESARVAGVTMTIACGNERGYSPPSGGLPRTPGDVPPPWRHPDQPDLGSLGGVITIGANGYHTDAYAYFSSYGPSNWRGISPWNDYATSPYLIKPDVCAPGQNVNSTIRGGGYSGDTWSGTSMATPHVAGLVALMLSKNPDLLPAQVDSIMETFSLPLGTPGKDNDYGSGRVRCPEIVSAVPSPGPDLIAPSSVADLATAPMPGFGHVRLNWTAPGDDGTVGTATSYDIRYRRATFGPIDDESKWAIAQQVTGEPTPQTAGTAETMGLGGLSIGTSFYFAIKSYDDAGNPSPLSNSPIGTASGHATPGSVGGIDIIIPGGSQVSAQGYVTLRTAEGQPVSGATVEVQWSGLVSGTVSATTDAQGTATFTSPSASAAAHGIFQFNVIAVSAGSADLGQGISAQMAYGTTTPALGGFSLAAPNPNPVGSRGSAIQFSLASSGPVSLRVYDVTGSLVRVLASGEFTAGLHQVSWDGRDDQGRAAGTGVYYLRLTSGDQTLSRKVTVLR